MTQDVKGAVKKDLKAQLRAERYFLDFCKYVDPKHPTEAPHMKALTKKLQQVAQYVLSGGKRGIPRLMIFMPPRYWKSQTASRKFPAWLLGKNPDLRIILTSYGADLATSHSKGARDLLKSERYDAVFGSLASADEPVILDAESKASAKWDIADHIGGMQAAGVGGAITGFGANLFIIDDPVKGRKEASSEKQRKDDFTWYKSTAFTRVEKNGAIIVIMTRWDVEDLAGQLLTKMVSDPEADQWEVVCMPAVALEEKQYPKTEEDFKENLLRGVFMPLGGDQLGRKPGESLWPNQDSKEALDKKAANMDDFEFTAQFQQTPRLAVGNFFDDDDFKIVDKAPEGLRWFRGVDVALGASKNSDHNATAAVAMDESGDLYIRDLIKIRKLESFIPVCRHAMLSEEERGTMWGIESVAFQALVLKDFLKDTQLANVPIRPIKVHSGSGKKTWRASAWQQRAKQGKVKLVRAPWNLGFIRVAAAFSDDAREDDEIDSVSLGVEMIANATRFSREVKSYQG